MKRDRPSGAVSWSGTFKDMPALITTDYMKARLNVFIDGDWYVWASGSFAEVKPRRCDECGTQLPKEDYGL